MARKEYLLLENFQDKEGNTLLDQLKEDLEKMPSLKAMYQDKDPNEVLDKLDRQDWIRDHKK